MYSSCNFDLMLSVGAIRKKGGIVEVDGHSHDLPCTWWVSWLAVQKPWSALAWPFLSFDMPCTWWLSWLAVKKSCRHWLGHFSSVFTRTGIEITPLPFIRGSIFGIVDGFQLRKAFTGRRALIIVSLLMSGHGGGHEPQEDWRKNL